MVEFTGYTVLEDQPHLARWDVEIRTFPTFQKALAFVRKQYRSKQDRELLTPHIRNDATGEIVG